MTEDNQRIIEKIRSLYKLGTDPNATHLAEEAANALAFARRLMLKHQIDESQLTDAERAEETYCQLPVQSFGMVLTAFETKLAFACANLLGTVQWFVVKNQDRRDDKGGIVINPINHLPKRAGVAVFYGPTKDVRECIELFKEWTVVIVAAARHLYGGALRGKGLSYAEGFASALFDKVSEMWAAERESVAASRSHEGMDCKAVAIVHNLVQAKKLKASEFLRSEGIRLKREVGHSNRRDPEALAQGRRDGAGAAFNRRTGAPSLGDGK